MRKMGILGIVMGLMLIGSLSGGGIANVKGNKKGGRLTCDQVTIWLTPCISYAVIGGKVSELCCKGIYSLNAAYKSGQDRRAACQCIKTKAANIPGINYDRVNAIAPKCGTKCPFKVYPTTNCSKVK